MELDVEGLNPRPTARLPRYVVLRANHPGGRRVGVIDRPVDRGDLGYGLRVRVSGVLPRMVGNVPETSGRRMVRRNDERLKIITLDGWTRAGTGGRCRIVSGGNNTEVVENENGRIK